MILTFDNADSLHRLTPLNFERFDTVVHLVLSKHTPAATVPVTATDNSSMQSSSATPLDTFNNEDETLKLEEDNLPNFEYFSNEGPEEAEQEEKEEANKKHKPNLPSTSDVLVKFTKKIHSFVGPSDLYLVVKGMKLKNTEVTTVKFLGTVPRLDISRCLSTRPNINRIVTDYGPIACTWSEFDAVRTNLVSFVVRSGNNYFDLCDFITL